MTIRRNAFFWIFSAVAAILLVGSFLLPPTGIIDPSVLAGVGEIFSFAALGVVIKAIDKGIDAKLTHGNTEIELNND